MTEESSKRQVQTASQSETPGEIHPRFKEADVVIVDQEDVNDIWPLLGPHQRLYSEDEYTKGALEFNLIGGPVSDNENEEPGRLTQIGYHALNDKRVLDLREERGGFGEALYGLIPSRDE